MSERTKRLRPSSGDWADRSVARLAGRRPWVLVVWTATFGVGTSLVAVIVFRPVSWHELMAWLSAGSFFSLMLGAGAVAIAERGRHLVDDAHSLDDVMRLDWRRFEELVGQIYRQRGWTVAQTQPEGDGGADLILTRRRERALVQCKRWRQDVDVLHVRAFYGVMAAERAKYGFFVTTSMFTLEAERFATAVGMQLVNGRQLLRDLADLRGDDQPALAGVLEEGEDTSAPSLRVVARAAESTPSPLPACPTCSSPMRPVVGQFGPFLGCSRYPRCKRWLPPPAEAGATQAR